ncbi:MAG: thiamine biosynthesis protein ThiF [Candidatus Cloacimonadota bacterium]|nr:MAG: thiamine biosynthesis protein ThiF [Candidatus Cloacimonadota bacterium]PIE78749.1 MAG: thiamine biosynthesis protein ThiF [Candidatus Delongbacteria bacterium]
MDIFQRNVSGMTEKLKVPTIGIAGCGGLGSNIANSLVRSGVSNLIIADFDIVEPSNLNRQSFYLEDLGKPKVEATAKYLKNINRDINLKVYNKKLTKDDILPLFGEVSIMIEAFDSVESKKMLIDTWVKNRKDKPIICGNGIAGFGSFESLKIRKVGNIYFCGDGEKDMKEGFSAPRVLIVANMQANLAIDLIMNA